jgi:hypothetical protein
MAIDSKKIETEITLELYEDEITVGEFTSALDHFVGLVREVSKSIDKSASREWLIKVYPGSAGIGLYTKPGQTTARLDAVRQTVLDGIVALEEGRRPSKFSDKAIEHISSISKVFEKRKRPVSGVRMWSGKDRAIQVKKEVAIEAAKILDPIYEDFGSVEGKLEIVSGHGRYECTIYDVLGDRAIKCELPERLLDDALGSFLKRVEVFGRVHYRQDGLAVKVLADRIEKFPLPHLIPSVDDIVGILRN